MRTAILLIAAVSGVVCAFGEPPQDVRFAQTQASLRVFGFVSARASARPDGTVMTELRCDSPRQARQIASKFLTDVRLFGDAADRFAVGVSGERAIAVFAEAGRPQLPDGFAPAATNDYPRFLDHFDNRPVSLGQGGWGVRSEDYGEALAWAAAQGFDLFGANYVTYDSWAAPGVWNFTVSDAVAAAARRLDVGYLDYPLMAHAENPSWFWNEVPMPYARGKDGAIGPAGFAYYRFSANGSGWPMPPVDPLVDYGNQECARRNAADDRFTAHFGSVEIARGHAVDMPGYLGEEDVPTMRDLAGWDPDASLDLRGTWTMDDGTNVPRRIDCRDPILLAYCDDAGSVRRPGGFSLTRTFDVSGDRTRYRYLHLSKGTHHGRVSDVRRVVVNGSEAKDLTFRDPLVGDLENCHDLAGLLREGRNEIRIEGLKGPLSHYAFLGREGRFSYPTDDERKNRLFFDMVETATRKVYRYVERRLRAIRAGDPTGHPSFVMCPTHIGELTFDAFRRYGGYSHDTGQTQACWAPWCSRYWKTRGLPVSCENGGVPPDVPSLRWMFTMYLLLGNDAVNLLFDPSSFRANGKGEWIESHRDWLRCLGKIDRERFDLCVMRSIRNASRLLQIEPWRQDPSRGILQAVGRVPGLVDPSDMVTGEAARFADVVMDAATTVLTPEETDGIVRFIEGGGLFVAMETTGRHSHLRRDDWPLARALGLKPGYGLKPGGGIVELVRGKGRFIVFPSCHWQAKDDGGSFKLAGLDGVTKLETLLDRLNVPRSSGGARTRGMKNCFAETWRSKNGLYDLMIVANLGKDGPTVAEPQFCCCGNVRQVVELSAAGHPQKAFAQAADGRVTLSDVRLETGESRVFATLREDAGFAPLYWLKSLERRWQELEPVPAVGKPALVAKAERRFLPLTDGWTHVEGNRTVSLGSYPAMGLDDDAETATFRKSFDIPADWKGRDVSLKFEAQGFIHGFQDGTRVTVNGRSVATGGNAGFRHRLPDAGTVSVEISVDGRRATAVRRSRPSGVMGVLFAEAETRCPNRQAISGWRPDLAGAVSADFASPPSGRMVYLASSEPINYIMLNGTMFQVPAHMGRVDVSGLLARDGRRNVIRWWPHMPVCSVPSWSTVQPKRIPELHLEY